MAVGGAPVSGANPVPTIAQAAPAALAIAGAPPAGTVGQPYAYTPNVTGGAGGRAFKLSGKLPQGLAFSEGTGGIAGTPAEAGTWSGLAISVADASGTATVSGLSLTVSAATVTKVAIAGTPGTPTMSAAFAFTPATTGGSGRKSFALKGAVPTGLSFSPTTGAISGTAGASGDFPLDIIVTDDSGSASLSFTLSIAGQGSSNAVSISGTPGAATVGAAYAFTPTTANGSGTKAFTLSGSLPAGLSFSSTTGGISGTPTTAGTTSGIGITVTDASGSASLSGLSIVVGAAPGPTPVQPNTVSGLMLWAHPTSGMYSDAGTTAAVNGGKVAQWNDASGNANHLTQATAANQPTLNTAAVNGLAGAVFSNSGQTSLVNPYIGTPGTIITVQRSTSSSGARTMVSGRSASGSNTASYQVSAVVSGTGGKIAWSVTSDGNNPTWYQSFSHDLNLWEIYGATQDGTTLKPFKRHTALSGTGNLTKPAAAINTSTAAVVGGGYFGSVVTDFFDGTIAEIIMYNRALTATEYANVMAGLEQKYNLTYTGNLVYPCFRAPSADLRLHMLQGDGATMRRRPVNYFNPHASMRDPSMYYDANNATFWLVHTTGNTGALGNFDLIKSADGVNWTFVAAVDCSSITGTTSSGRTWAPEWDLTDPNDPAVLVNLSADSGASQAAYWLKPTNAARTTWTAPTLIDNSGKPAVQIDVFVVKLGGTYYLFNKDDTTKYVDVATSTSRFTGYTEVKTGNWAGWGGSREGTSVLDIGDRYRAILDAQGSGLYYTDNMAKDLVGTWTALAAVTVAGPDAFVPQHGTLISMPSAMAA